MQQPSSNIFEGYKSVGHICNSLPFIVRHGKNPQDTRIVTLVGKTFHTYTTNLNLVEVSIPHEHEITSIISDERHIYTASDRSILCWSRGSKSVEIKLDNGHQARIKFMTKFGTDNLVSIDEDNVLFHWKLIDKEILNIISFDDTIFKISAICHPLNHHQELLIGSEQGQIQLWSIGEEKCLSKFDRWTSKVRCLAQSPVEDVIGIGLEDGNIFILNIRHDKLIMKIYQEYGPVTSMSFRLDDQPYLVTASEVGHLMVWNLERRRLSSQIRNAHNGSITKCQFIRNESLLVTSGHDNCVKIWTMDLSDGGGTLLTQRSGHSKPPSSIKFYGSKGFQLLSAGEDSSIQMFHMYSERLNRNLGIARINPKSKYKDSLSHRKLPPISCFAAESAKEKHWDNIAACHLGSSLVTTWNFDKCKMGEHLISQPSFDKHEVYASTICISSCGNFVIIGFSNGLVFKYNMQSGIFKQTYEDNELNDHRAHDGLITGVTVDGLVLVLITSGLDKKLRLWNFKTGLRLMVWDCCAPIIKIELHKENNLLAVALDNNDIQIRDLEAKTLVRQFSSSSNIIDLVISPDSRWLIACYEDNSIRTWDLNLGKLIDMFKLSSKCTSLSMSSTGEFLATAHENSLGINIWCNFTIYCPTPLKIVDPEGVVPLLDMPYVRCDDFLMEDNDHNNEDVEMLDDLNTASEPRYLSPSQLSDDLLTLSGQPSSRWKNLLNVAELRELQQIQQEQKLERPLKVPFFIPVKDGLRPQLDLETLNAQSAENQQQPTSNSKIHHLNLLSPLAKCLLQCGDTGDYGPFVSQLKDLGPSAIDAEIRYLGADTCGDSKPMICFLNAIEHSMKHNSDYELVNSWLALFLKAHSDIIQADTELQARCKDMSEIVSSRWNRLSEKFNQTFCVLNYIRSSIL